MMTLLSLPREVLAVCVLTRLEHRHVDALSKSQRHLRDACEEYYERARGHMASMVVFFEPVLPARATLSDLLIQLRAMGLFEPFVKYRHYNDCKHTLLFTIVVREYNLRLTASCHVECAVRVQYRSFYMTMYKGKHVTCLYESDLRNLVCDRLVVSDTLEDAVRVYNENARRPPRVTAI